MHCLWIILHDLRRVIKIWGLNIAGVPCRLDICIGSFALQHACACNPACLCGTFSRSIVGRWSAACLHYWVGHLLHLSFCFTMDRQSSLLLHIESHGKISYISLYDAGLLTGMLGLYCLLLQQLAPSNNCCRCDNIALGLHRHLAFSCCLGERTPCCHDYCDADWPLPKVINILHVRLQNALGTFAITDSTYLQPDTSDIY